MRALFLAACAYAAALPATEPPPVSYELRLDSRWDRPPKAEALGPAIEEETTRFLSLYGTAEEVNTGRCGAFAMAVYKKAGGTFVHIRATTWEGYGVGSHTVLLAGGRMYDIEHPEGVTHFGDLEYFKRTRRILAGLHR